MKIPVWIIVLIAIVVGYLLRALTSPAQFIKGDTITYHIDSSKKYFSYNTEVANPPKITGTKTDTFYKTQKVDTSSILKEYFTKNYYRQSIRDTNIALSIFDTIGQNRIEGRGINYVILKPQSVEKNVQIGQKATHTLSMGAIVSAPIDLHKLITSVNAAAMWNDKKGRKWIFYYDIVNRSAGAGLLIPIIGTR